ncbi:MAG: hypothetical protein R2769_01040 [Saprospiraceae bacterium]
MEPRLFAFSFLLLVSGFLTVSSKVNQEGELPKVFLLGQYEKEYEMLSIDYKTLLLEACDNDLVAAHEKWQSMLMEMEAYADQIDFDINGVKIWVHVFWNASGTIDHLAYYLKPQSRNINTDELTAFFKSFSNHYQFPLISETKYAHYGSAGFPVYPMRLGKSDK